MLTNIDEVFEEIWNNRIYDEKTAIKAIEANVNPEYLKVIAKTGFLWGIRKESEYSEPLIQELQKKLIESLSSEVLLITKNAMRNPFFLPPTL